jgi:hypothetical protein
MQIARELVKYFEFLKRRVEHFYKHTLPELYETRNINISQFLLQELK